MKPRLIIPALAGLALSAFLFPGEAPAECGPGPIIFKKSKGILQQSVAISTNILISPIYFLAITTGTSDCTNDGIIKREHEQSEFVAWNLENLSRDMARGQGSHLAALAGLMGCRPAVYPDFTRLAKANYARLFPVQERRADALLVELKREMASDPVLSAGCTRIS